MADQILQYETNLEISKKSNESLVMFFISPVLQCLIIFILEKITGNAANYREGKSDHFQKAGRN